MNIEFVAKFVVQWKMHVRKRKEVRSILIQQYRHIYIKVLYCYRELKKKRFQQYIINNASNLIYKALKINLWKVQHLKQIIEINKVKRLYFFKSQENLFKQITNLESNDSLIKTIRLPLQSKCNHRNLVPLLFKKIKQAVIVCNFHEMKKSFGEVTTSRDYIRYELLYYFTKLITVKLSQKPFKLSSSEVQRYQHILKKIDKFQQDEYQLLKYIEVKNLNCLKQIYVYNRKNRNKQLQVFFDFQIREVAAVCKIQKFYRAYRNRTILKLGMRLDAIMKKINQSRAIFVIQRWFKRLRWQHRINFFKDISFYVSQIPTQHLYLDMQIYQKIEEIINSLQFSIKFIEQYNVIVSDHETCRLQFSTLQDFQQSSYSQSLKCFESVGIQVIPKWLLRQIQFVPEKIEKKIDYAVIKQEEIVTKWSCRNRSHQTKHKQSLKQLKFYQMSDVYQLLHLGAQISFENIRNRDYIRFSYSSTCEARYRVIALALQTYKFKCNGTSILLLSDNLWENPQQKQECFLQKYKQKISRVHKIEFAEQTSSYLSNNNQCAVILCEKEQQCEKFSFPVNEIQLQFFNETSRITKNLFWMMQVKNKKKRSLTLHLSKIKNNTIDNQEQKDIPSNNQKINSSQMSPHSIIEGSSKSTQVPVKFSILSIENNKIQYQEPKFKRRTEQSFIEFATTSRFRTQNNSLNNSKLKEQESEILENSYTYKKNREVQRLDNISENSEYQSMKRKYQEEILIENREKIARIKKKRENEKIFLSEFVNFTSLLQRQEQKVVDKQIKTQRVRSNERGYKHISNPKDTIAMSQSVSRREDYSDVSIVFPKIEQRRRSTSKKKNTSRLSNYHRYAVFPEELYAISGNNDTIKF